MSLPVSAPRIRAAWPVVFVLCLCLPGLLASCNRDEQPTFRLTGRVVDQANLLSPAVEADLTQSSAALEKTTSDQFVIVTVKDLNGTDISDFGLTLGRQWKLGQSGKTRDTYGHRHKDNGILLIVAPNDHKVRIEVGTGLEPVLSNEKAARIIATDMSPLLTKGQYEDAIVSGSAAIINTLRQHHPAAIDHHQEVKQ